jgi:hypothetical protein
MTRALKSVLLNKKAQTMGHILYFMINPRAIVFHIIKKFSRA